MPLDSQAGGPMVVAIDGSLPARTAARIAIHIARSQARLVRGIYVADESLIVDPYATHDVELGDTAGRTARSDLVELAQRQGDTVLAWLSSECEAAHVAFVGEVILGRVAEVILGAAESAAFVTLGRRGLTHEQERGQLGQHFRAVAHRLECPVIAGGLDERLPEHLLLAYNGSAQARRALECASGLQRSLRARVTVLAVVEADTAAAAQWLEEARQQCGAVDSSRYALLTRTGEPVATIAATATEVGADCVVLGSYRHPQVIEFLLGSTVDGVLTQVELPTIIA
jgi:nucleotide-binding universal stress UspA family protein